MTKDFIFNPAMILTFISIILYIIVVSIFTSKFQSVIKKMNQDKSKFKHRLISKETCNDLINFNLKSIKNFKTLSIFFLLSVFLIHITISLFLSFDILLAIVPFAMFSSMQFLNFWLRGKGIANSVKNFHAAVDSKVHLN